MSKAVQIWQGTWIRRGVLMRQVVSMRQRVRMTPGVNLDETRGVDETWALDEREMWMGEGVLDKRRGYKTSALYETRDFTCR